MHPTPSSKEHPVVDPDTTQALPAVAGDTTNHRLSSHPDHAARARSPLARLLKSLVFFLIIAAVLGLALSFVFGMWEVSAPVRDVPETPALGVELVKDMPNTLQVPEDVRLALGIRKNKQDQYAVAETPTHTRPLMLSGTTNLDPTTLYRIRIRFAPAEVAEVGKFHAFSPSRAGETELRELHSGDPVKKGDLLAVLYSPDVGAKKNDLIDALVQQKLDEEILRKAEPFAASISEALLLTYRRNVETDRNAISRAVNTLKTWNISDEDIQAAYDEAEQINNKKSKRDPNKIRQWARVELRAQEDGTLVERNVTVHETIVDNTMNLFQVARLDRMLVVANASEDDLPELVRLKPDQLHWIVYPSGLTPPGRLTPDQPAGGIPGPIDDIGRLIDVAQHSAVVKGYIPNPDQMLRGGQFVSASIQLPPPPDVVEVPMTAIVDDGRQCIVFVQVDAEKQLYTMRRVDVTHRFDKVAFVRTRVDEAKQKLTKEEKELGLLPLSPLRKGERVLASGVLELKKQLEDLNSGQ